MKKIIYTFLFVSAWLFCANRVFAQTTNKIDSVGDVGIGTVTPMTLLHVSSSTPGASNLRIENTSGTFETTTDFLELQFKAKRGLSTSDRAKIYVGRQGIGGSDNDAFMGFSTNTGGALSEKMRITADGKIGIGTNIPDRKLHIDNSFAGYIPAIKLQNEQAGTGYGVGIEFQLSTDYIDYKKAEIRALAESDYGNAIGMSFWTGGSHESDHAERLRISSDGNVGIGTTTPYEKLSVNGNVKAKKFIVTQLGWSDYVFDNEYKLRSLPALEEYIKQNKHLPEIPTAKEVEEKGSNIGDNQALLLKKIEELTLYVIELRKENIKQQNQINQLLKRILK